MTDPTDLYYGFQPDMFIADLDRCEHGRHVADRCFGCPDGNRGNPLMRGEERRLETGELILAYSVGGSFMYVLVRPEDHVPGTYPVRKIRVERES